MVPGTAPRDVGERDATACPRRPQRFFEGQEGRVQAELQDDVHPPPELRLQLKELVKVVRTQDERLFANCVSPQAEGQARV